MKPEIAAEHAWLKKFVGTWTFEGTCDMGPGQPPHTMTGTETGRMLGETFVAVAVDGSDGTHAWAMTLGFDPARRRFVGNWVGSMMTHQWVYDGALDGNTIVLECDGPNFSDPTKTGRYLDAHEFVDADHRILHASTLGDDGRWREFMTTHYRRKA